MTLSIMTLNNPADYYHIDKLLKSKWDRVRGGKLKDLDEDRVYVVDGRERSGKSLFALQQAYYIDPTIIIPEEAKKRIVFGPDDFLKAVRETESTKDLTKVIIFDEAFRGLSSRGIMSKVNKSIIQALMEMGQKNLVVFIVLPSFFMLDLYPAMLRSNALFHIKKAKNSKLRSFYVYNYTKKSLLYQIGVRKGWQYSIYTPLKGRFFGKYPGGDKFEAFYRKLKRLAIESMPIMIEKEQDKVTESLEKALIFDNKRLESGMSQRELAKWWEEVTGKSITHARVNQMLKKVRESVKVDPIPS